MLRSRSVFTGWVIALLIVTLPEQASAQGLQLYGIGPVNRSMSGAATAAPIEAIGALVYNLSITHRIAKLAVAGKTTLSM